MITYKKWGDWSNNRPMLVWQYDTGGEYSQPDDAFDTEVYRELVRILCLDVGLDRGLVPIANRIPQVYPWQTIIVKILGQPMLGWRESGGNPGAYLVRNTNLGTPAFAYAGWVSDPQGLAAGIAHELVHLYRRPDYQGPLASHETELVNGGPNLMAVNAPTGGRLSRARIDDMNITIKRFMAGDRFGTYTPRPQGTTTFGWSNVNMSSFQ